MSGSTSRTLTEEYFRLTLSTPCIDFVSGEQEYHREAEIRIARALEAVRGLLVAALPRVIAAVAGAPALVRYDEARSLQFYVPAPECAELRLCFESLPDPGVVEDLKRILREFFSGLPW